MLLGVLCPVKAVPPNDDPANATLLSADSYISRARGPIAGATWNMEFPDLWLPSVWHRWTAPISGKVAVQANGLGFWVFGSAYREWAPGVYTRVGTSTLSSGWRSTGATNTEFSFDAVGGATYLIAVRDGGTFGNVPEASRYYVLAQAFLPNPFSDNFATRPNIGGTKFTIRSPIVGYGAETGEPEHGPVSRPAARAARATGWVSYQTPVRRTVSMNVSAAFDPLVSVYTGETFPTLERVAQGVGSQIGNQWTTRLSFVAEANVPYAIAFDGAGRTGVLQLSVETSIARPGFALAPQSTTVQQGTSAIFTAVAASTGPATYRWQRQRAGTREWVDLFDTTNLSGSATGTLVVGAVTLAMNQDRYRVIVTDSIGTTTSNPVVLTVTEFAPIAQEFRGTINAFDLSEGNVSGDTYHARGLPRGLSIDPNTGVISGVITGRPGTYRVTYWATTGGVRSQAYVLLIHVAPFPSDLVGRFEGLLTEPDLGLPGQKMELRVAANGAFSGRVFSLPDSRAYPFKGVLSLNQTARTASAEVLIRRGRDLTPRTLQFVVREIDSTFAADFSEEGGELVASTTTGFRLGTFSAAEPAPWAGEYSGHLTTSVNTGPDVPLPGGYSWTFATIEPATGILRMRGRLADNAKVTAATRASEDGEYLVARRMYPGVGGAVAGWVDFTRIEGSLWYEVAGAGSALFWSKPARERDRYYPEGFGALGLGTNMQRWWVPLVPLTYYLGLGDSSDLILRVQSPTVDNGGENPRQLPTDIEWMPTNGFRVKGGGANPSRFKMSVNPLTGAFTGSFEVTDVVPERVRPVKRTVSFSGAFQQPRQMVAPGTVLGRGLMVIPPLPGSDGLVRTGLIEILANAPPLPEPPEDEVVDPTPEPPGDEVVDPTPEPPVEDPVIEVV